jgi:Ulp1 protease family, C-terminal catalytic domain
VHRNFLEKEFYFLNPLGSVTNDKGYYNRFIEFIKLRNSINSGHDYIDPSNWTLKYLKYPKQRDGYSCGVYVLHYIDTFCSEYNQFDLNLDPAEFRIKVQAELLGFCNRVTETICLYCCKPNCKCQNPQWFECKKCTTWFRCDAKKVISCTTCTGSKFNSSKDSWVHYCYLPDQTKSPGYMKSHPFCCEPCKYHLVVN